MATADSRAHALLILDERLIVGAKRPDRGHHSLVWTVRSCCTIETLTSTFEPGTKKSRGRTLDHYTLWPVICVIYMHIMLTYSVL